MLLAPSNTSTTPNHNTPTGPTLFPFHYSSPLLLAPSNTSNLSIARTDTNSLPVPPPSSTPTCIIQHIRSIYIHDLNTRTDTNSLFVTPPHNRLHQNYSGLSSPNSRYSSRVGVFQKKVLVPQTCEPCKHTQILDSRYATTIISFACGCFCPSLDSSKRDMIFHLLHKTAKVCSIVICTAFITVFSISWFLESGFNSSP